ncbi:LPXTG cell wall anchor domain-containing protein, partial [Catellatospora citrea]
TPTPGGQTPTPGASTGGPGVTPSSSEQPGLPVTGAAVTVFAAVGLALVIGGAGTLFLVRRRRDLPTEV